MYELEFIEHFKKVPVFSLSDVNQLVRNKDYVKRFLKKMISKGKAYKIKKGMYSLHKDSFLVSSFIKKPSYISSLSALQYHRVITQIPRKVFCMALNSSCFVDYFERIDFFKTNNFFGYNLEDYEGFKIPVADVEKAIIDSISLVPLHLVEEAMSEIDKDKMLEYLFKIKKSSILKRIGYLMEINGFDVYDDLKKYLNYKKIFLDPLANKKGKMNKKWSLIINTN